MSSVLARTGRHRQRYENEFRLVAGCIPYRFRKDNGEHPDSQSSLEVLMISSPNRNDLVFPKGGWENDETVYEAACREALEEAGVKGTLDEHPLGVWIFRSKSRQNSCSQEGSCKGYMFPLEVTEEFDVWPEEDNRSRKWLSVEEAFRLCRYEWMQSALQEFMRVISASGKYEISEDLVSLPVLPVQEMVPEHQIMSPSCYLIPSSNQRLDDPPYKFDDSPFKCFVLG